MEARPALEQFAAGAVVRRGRTACETLFERLSAEIDRQRAAGSPPDLREFLESDRAFHTAMVEAAENPILAGFYSSLRDRQMRMIGESAVRDPRRITTVFHEHRDIAETLRDTDLDRALRAVRVHLANTVRALGLAIEPTSPFHVEGPRRGWIPPVDGGMMQVRLLRRRVTPWRSERYVLFGA